VTEYSPAEVVRHASTWSILWGILLIVLGVLAVALPLVAAVVFSIAIGWLLILAGIVHIAVAFHSHKAGRLVWRLLVGLAYAFIGVYLLVHPLLGVASLTLVLAALFLVEGVLNIILFFNMRSMRGKAWVLVDGIISLLLGLFIYLQWPSSSFWALGILVGMSMIVSGIARVMLSAAVRKVGSALA
jgi:uncharacterized membrane protein HdeD (DUF308 family)